MKKCLEVLALGLVMAALFGCPPPEPPATGGGTISGTVRDAVTGGLVEGVTVEFGSYSDVTDFAGAYSIEVPASVTTVTGTFVAYKGLEYSFRACSGIAVNPTTDPVYDFDIYPYDVSGYTDVTLSGRIYDNTDTEISDSCALMFFFANAEGGRCWNSAMYSATEGYSISTITTGTNCFVYVDVWAPSMASYLFGFYVTGENLTSDLTNHDLTQPPDEDYTSVTINGDTGSFYMGNLLLSDSLIFTNYIVGMLSGPTDSIEVYNSANYPVQWMAGTVAPDTPPGCVTMSASIATLPFSDTIDLPAAYTGPVPTGIVDEATVGWNGTTLSFTPASGANGHMVWVQDNAGHCGSIQMASAGSVTFPSGFVASVLTPGSGWDLVIWPEYCADFTPAILLENAIGMHPEGEVGERPMPFEAGVGIIQCGLTKADAIP